MRQFDELDGGARQVFVFAIDNFQLARDFQIFNFQCDQSFCPQFRFNRKLRDEGDAKPALHRLLDRFRVAEFDDRFKLQICFAQTAFNDRLCCRPSLAENEMFIRYVTMVDCSAVGESMIGRDD